MPALAKVVLAPAPKVPDEILERIRRQVGPTDDRHRRLRDEADRCECRLRIVGKLAIESGRGREFHVIDEQGVAVRVGAHRATGGDRPPAPPAFSIVICWPRIFDMACAVMREIASVGPPAAAGTMTLIGRVG